MTRLEAIKSLARKVEAELDTAHDHAAAFPSESAYGHCTWHDSHQASTSDSLDAAKALHEAMLPDFGWRVGVGNTCIYKLAGSKGYEQSTGFHNPARAWLLAILRALIAQEEAQ